VVLGGLKEWLMNDVETFLLIAVGVALSVLYPVLVAKLREAFPAVAGNPWRTPWVRKYTLLFAFSLITALIVYAVYLNVHPNAKFTWYGAIILGIGWQAVCEKLVITPKKT
jgi:uncharacterized BrkB/YihY/UPF0761 family membrane protein